MKELTKPQMQGGFSAWVKEDRIPPIRRDHHRKTWERAQQVLLQELRDSGALSEAEYLRRTVPANEGEPISQWDMERLRAGVVAGLWNDFEKRSES